MNVLLIIVGIIFGVCIFSGYKKGLIKIVLSLVTSILIFVLVGVFSPHVSSWLRKATPLEDNIQKKVTGILLPDDTDMTELQNVKLTKEQQISLIENADIPEMFRDMLLNNNNDEIYESLGAGTFGEYISSYIAKMIVDLIGVTITMVVITILVVVAMSVFKIVDKIPLVGGANRIAGGIVGIGNGLIIVWFFFIVVTLLYNTTFGKMCFANIEASSILKKLYDSNLLMSIITKF